MREGDSKSARLHLAAIRRQLDAEEPQYRHEPSTPLPQLRQHLQPAVAIGGRDPGALLEILDRLHGVVADAAVGAAGIKAGLGQTRLHLLHLGEREHALRAGEAAE